MVTKVTRITLPGTTDPYNNVEYLELRLGDLDAKLITNSELVETLGSAVHSNGCELSYLLCVRVAYLEDVSFTNQSLVAVRRPV